MREALAHPTVNALPALLDRLEKLEEVAEAAELLAALDEFTGMNLEDIVPGGWADGWELGAKLARLRDAVDRARLDGEGP